MPLKSVDNHGNILEPWQLDQLFSSYQNPWDDPYSDLTQYFNMINKRNERDDESVLCDVSAAVNLVSFRNMDDWCYSENFDSHTLAQVTSWDGRSAD